MHLHIKIFVLVIMIDFALSQLTSVQNISGAHSGTVVGVAMSSDQSFFITAGSDSLLKMWNTQNYQLLNSKKYSAPITALNIDLQTDYIYVCTQDSGISVIDPSDFTQLNPNGVSSYPNSGYANSIVFSSDYSQFYLGGNTQSSNTQIQIYDFQNTNYSNLGNTILSTFSTNSQIVSMANLDDTSIIAAVNQNNAYLISIFQISNNAALQQTLTDCQNSITSVHYDSTLANIFSTSTDSYIRIFQQTTTNNEFQQMSLLDVSDIGIPYDLSSDIGGFLYAAIGSNLVQFTYNQDGAISINSITNQFELTGEAKTMIISSQQDYILVGCQNGDVNIFNFSLSSFNREQIIIIVTIVGTFVILIPFMIKKFFCKKEDDLSDKLDKNGNITLEDIHPTVS